MATHQHQLPDSGFLRLKQIIGDVEYGIPPLVPVSRSTWWAGIREGRFPAPVKLGARAVGWRVADIVALIERLGGTAAPQAA